MPRTARNIVEDSLGPQRCNALWTANYLAALPMTPQNFDIGALLPAILYMMRWGRRRGRGKLTETFGQLEGRTHKPPTIADVAKYLTKPDSNFLSDFRDEIGQAILGDLLLAYCLENTRRALGHSEPLLRVFPTHYLSSWIDLPKEVSHLRGAPELLVVLLTLQETGDWLESGKSTGPFSIGTGFTKNVLLNLFGRCMSIRGRFSDLNSDTFIEVYAAEIGIDELLPVRIAQACGSAPLQARGGDESERIANRHPLANRAASYLCQDLSVFIEVYGTIVPRQAFLQMLEAGIALGMTNLLLSTANLLTAWEVTGQVPKSDQQNSLPLFVDCSHGQDKILRDLSESSSAECIRRYERLPLLMMLLRVLDDRVRIDRKLRDSLPASIPDATTWINLLGEIVQERHPRSEAILDTLDEDCLRLAEALEKDQEISEPEIAHRLRYNQGNPALRLAETLCELMGDKLQRTHYVKSLDSALMVDLPNGLAIKRRMRRSANSGERRAQDLRAIVLTPPALEFLVHRHLQRTATESTPLSLQGFITLLRDRYGLYIAHEPPGQPIPQEMLLRNKAYLERRLRDLGLLIGVNDAESMKQLKPHYYRETCNAA